MQRESTFRLEPLPLTEKAQQHIAKVRALAVDLFDALVDIEYSAKIEKNKVLDDIAGCLSVAKSKLQESTFWANRAASYVGHFLPENELKNNKKE